MRLFIVFMFHVLAHSTCLAKNKSCSDCQLDFKCCQGYCRPCFNCQLYLREGGPCVCNLNDCGNCLKGYEEVSKTKFSSTHKACRVVKTSQNGTVKCTSDESCLKDKYCFSGRCISCFDCKLYHREPSRFPCAKHPSDCGSCVEGYFEAPVTHYSKVKSCSYRADYVKYKFVTERNFLYVLLIVIVGSGIFTVFYLRRNKKETIRSNISEVERPTSYAPVSSSVSCSEEIVFTYIREEAEKSNATANVETSSESVHLSSPDEEVLNAPDSPINYDDEETIPSSWTPNPRLEIQNANNENSFRGIFNRITEDKATESAEECVEKSDNEMCQPDTNVEIGELETATQNIHIEEDTTKS